MVKKTKKCPHCGKTKTKNDFYVTKYNYLSSYCIDCISKYYKKHAGKKLEYLKRYYRKNKERINKRRKILYQNRTKKRKEKDKENRFLKRYGVSLIEVETMVEKQNGKCPICERKIYLQNKEGKRRACVDHCHLFNKVRGLLCLQCNLVLGTIESEISKNPNFLQNIVFYLKPGSPVDNGVLA